MKKGVVELCLCFGLSIAFLTGFDTNRACAVDVIKLGFVGSNTGLAADLGSPSSDAAKLFVKELNQSGGVNGKKLQLINYDDESNPAKATTLTRKLIEVDNALAMISGSTTGCTLAMLKASQELKMPHIVCVAQSPIVTEPVNPWTFRITGNFNHEIERMMVFLMEKNVKRLAMLSDSGVVGSEAKRALFPKIKEAGIELVADESVAYGALDVTAQTLNMRKANPDMILFYGYGPESAMLGKTLKQVGWNVPVLGNRGLAMPIFLQLGGKAVDGFVITDNFRESKLEAKVFADKFEAEYGRRPVNAFPALGYDAVGVAVAAFKIGGDAATSDRAKFRDAFERIDKYIPVSGGVGCYFSFSPTKHDGPTGTAKEIVVMRRAENGKYIDY